MIYIVEFDVDGESISYTVKADNVLLAEEAAKEELKMDVTKSELRGSPVSKWKVKQIEHIPNA
jgi:hypothetical protein|tara:strand:- start:1307 stop:1495 length:189 start_codon:yes stop_codon:yes gene_type:complete